MFFSEIPRAAVTSWCPFNSSKRLLSVGTLAGTVGSDFDSTSKLEIWRIESDLSTQGNPDSNTLLGSITIPDQFHRLVWVPIKSDEYPYGVITGGLSNGTVGIWDPVPIMNSDNTKNPLLSYGEGHLGAVTSLDYNPKQPTLLASGSINNELAIWNISDPVHPKGYSPGSPHHLQANSEITCVKFNPTYKYILASSTANGVTVIWDLKQKKQVISFSDTNRPFRCRSFAWCPDQPMKIATASDEDDYPVIHLWDLSVALTPYLSLNGHQYGIKSISWSNDDTSLLLSTGKDMRTICWDVTTGEQICEVGASLQCNSQVEWASNWRTVFNVCSFDGKVRIYSLSDFENIATNQSYESAKSAVSLQQPSKSSRGSGDFTSVVSAIASKSKQTTIDVFQISRSMKHGAQMPYRCPGWIRRSSGVTFGFGGILVSFGKSSNFIKIHQLATENEFTQQAQNLANALANQTFSSYCDLKISSAADENSKELWETLKSLIENSHDNFKQSVLEKLDFNPSRIFTQIQTHLNELPIPNFLLDDNDSSENSNNVKNTEDPATTSNGDVSSSVIANGNNKNDFSYKNNENGEIFANEADDPSQHSPYFAVNSYNNNNNNSPINPNLPESNLNSISSRLSEKFGTKITGISPILFNSEDSTERILTNAMLIGNLELAVECCILTERLDDALLIASMGDAKLIKYTRNVYLRKHRNRAISYIINGMVNRDWMQLVERVDLDYWKEMIVLLHIYTKEEFGLHVKRLGQRLSKKEHKFATICFILANALDDLAGMWLGDISKIPNGVIPISQKLHSLIEKFIVFSNENIPDSILIEFYTYLELLASEGNFTTALIYLSGFKRIPVQNEQNFEILLLINELCERIYNALPIEVASSIMPEAPLINYGSTIQMNYNKNIMENNTISNTSSNPNNSKYPKNYVKSEKSPQAIKSMRINTHYGQAAINNNFSQQSGFSPFQPNIYNPIEPGINNSQSSRIGHIAPPHNNNNNNNNSNNTTTNSPNTARTGNNINNVYHPSLQSMKNTPGLNSNRKPSFNSSVAVNNSDPATTPSMQTVGKEFKIENDSSRPSGIRSVPSSSRIKPPYPIPIAMDSQEMKNEKFIPGMQNSDFNNPGIYHAPQPIVNPNQSLQSQGLVNKMENFNPLTLQGVNNNQRVLMPPKGVQQQQMPIIPPQMNQRPIIQSHMDKQMNNQQQIIHPQPMINQPPIIHPQQINNQQQIIHPQPMINQPPIIHPQSMANQQPIIRPQQANKSPIIHPPNAVRSPNVQSQAIKPIFPLKAKSPISQPLPVNPSLQKSPAQIPNVNNRIVMPPPSQISFSSQRPGINPPDPIQKQSPAAGYGQQDAITKSDRKLSIPKPNTYDYTSNNNNNNNLNSNLTKTPSSITMPNNNNSNNLNCVNNITQANYPSIMPFNSQQDSVKMQIIPSQKTKMANVFIPDTPQVNNVIANNNDKEYVNSSPNPLISPQGAVLPPPRFPIKGYKNQQQQQQSLVNGIVGPETTTTTNLAPGPNQPWPNVSSQYNQIGMKTQNQYQSQNRNNQIQPNEINGYNSNNGDFYKAQSQQFTVPVPSHHAPKSVTADYNTNDLPVGSYVTGPQAEIEAQKANQKREITCEEAQAITMLRQISQRIPAIKADLDSRINELEERARKNPLGTAASVLMQFADSVSKRDVARADHTLHEISKKHSRVINGKINIGLNRILTSLKNGEL